MQLSTGSYLPRASLDLPPGQQPTAGWEEVTKGLLGILAGYAVSIVSVAAVVALVLSVVAEVGGPTALSAKQSGDAATVLYVGAGILFLTSLLSLALILRGQWRCLMNAPEHCGAKWLMFASMLCVVAGPTMGTLSGFATDAPTPPVQAQARATKPKGPMPAPDRVKHYREAVATDNAAGYMRLASALVNLLSTVFFVLFLRGVALAFDDQLRTRIVEFYLLFFGLVVGASALVVVDPSWLITLPEVLLLLAGGWVLCFVGYFLLILNTCACISAGLARQRAPVAS
jgi:hypothetical protein